MSGQKDLTVHAVDQRLIEARRLAQQRIEEQRRQAESSIASIRSELAVTSRKAAEANQQLEQLQARQQRIQSQLSQLSDERRRLSAQLRAMNRETLQARDEASALSAKVEQDYRDTENQIGRLAQLERQLIDEENDLERRMTNFAGTEATAYEREFRQLDAKLQAELQGLLGLQVEIQAFATDPILGTILHEMVASAKDLGFEISRVFSSANEVEIFVTNQQKETIRLAAQLKQQELDQWTQDLQLRKLILQGDGHSDQDSCLVDTMRLLDRVRTKGIDLQLKVESGGGSAHRERSPTSPSYDRDRE